jgi:tRNA/tmRNA/rRNA uracil-C5-methylase (TrmA/RlmC/RlmD family)
VANQKIEIENKSSVQIHGLRPGAKLLVEVDGEGTIINRLYRRRVSDNDECIVLTDKAKKIVAQLKEAATKKAATQKKGGNE